MRGAADAPAGDGESRARPLRLCVCWTDISGYMAACWRALSAHPLIDLHVVAYAPAAETGFDPSVMDGISWTPLSHSDRTDRAAVASTIEKTGPDVIVLCGWMNSAYRALPRNPDLASAAFILAMDTPWRATLRQRLAPFVLGGFLRCMHAAVVPAERARIYARHLGFAEERIFTGLYGIDFDGFAPLFDRRAGGDWPRAFVFVGRYAPEKAPDILVSAYATYRRQVGEPWPLITVGQGPLKPLLAAEGIEDQGFRQPAELREILRRSGVSVLPSRFDPWPLALVEACAAGLPVIASNACGSAVECIRDHVNGILVPTGDADALAEAMIAMHGDHARLPEMGARSREMARPYAAELWALRWQGIIAAASRHRTP